MTAIDIDQLATDSTVAWVDYNTSMSLPDFSVLNVAFDKFGKMLNAFFSFKNHPQIPFYDTPQGATYNKSYHKKIQMKRRILEYQAKY